MELLLKGGRVVDFVSDFCGDIYIKDGKIIECGDNLNYSCKTINCDGLVVMPSFTDMHVHFREPGYEYKEDIHSGSLAALRGGYTCVNLMANTNPICSNMEIVDFILNRARELDLIDIHQTVAITKNFDGKTIDHIDNLDSSVKFLSDDGKGVKDNLVMYNALKKAKEKGLTIIAHEEDDSLVDFDTRLSENIMTKRDIELARSVNGKIHLAHVSTKEAITDIIKAKAEGVPITCEVTPHHLALHDNDYKVNPPIRELKDVEALIGALKDGYVDIIATDHAPHGEEDKKNGACGISGLETSFSVCYTTLVKDGHISLNKLSELMSKNPSELMNVNKGKIKPGYDGDLVLVKLDSVTKVDSSTFVSKGKNTPFHGREYYGEILATIKGGKVKYNGGIVSDN